MTSILLADDHPMIRTAIEVLLRDTDYVVAAIAATGAEAEQLVDSVQPDILMLDLQMPGGSGMEALRALRRKGSQVRIIILTAAVDDASLMEAQALGVTGMVLKNSDPAYLLECLDHVCGGKHWIDPELATRTQALSHAVRHRGATALAPRERQLIGYVRQGLRNRDIASALGVTEGTVKVYLHGIFEKLGVSSRTELAVRADEFLARSFMKK